MLAPRHHAYRVADLEQLSIQLEVLNSLKGTYRKAYSFLETQYRFANLQRDCVFARSSHGNTPRSPPKAEIQNMFENLDLSVSTRSRGYRQIAKLGIDHQ